MNIETEKVIKEALDQAVEQIQQKPHVSELILRQILRCDPESQLALSLLGLALHRLQKNVEAIEVLQTAIEQNPDSPDNYNNIALAYGDIGRNDIALGYAKKAVQVMPECNIFYNNLSIQYRHLGYHDLAIAELKKAIEVQEDPHIWDNLGGVYGEIKDLDAAKKCFEKALEINPDYSASHINLAFTLHLMGDYARGFKEYEWRTEYFPQMRSYLKEYDQTKRWRDPNESIEGKRILLYAEQGLGDLIMALRWMPLLKARGVSEIILHCDNILDSIVSQVKEVDRVIHRNLATSEGDDLPEYDIQCCILSLPYLLQHLEASGEPYLTANPPANIRRNYPNTFNVGICWAGGPFHPRDGARSTYLKNFKTLQLPGVKLFSVQKDARPRKRNSDKQVIDYTEDTDNMKVVDMSAFMTDFSATTSIVGGLDLVITVDTALLHLCGAIGVPCWGLIAYNPDWRWGITGETTPWYDSVKLFRQDEIDDWQGVFSKVTEKLSEIIAI